MRRVREPWGVVDWEEATEGSADLVLGFEGTLDIEGTDDIVLAIELVWEIVGAGDMGLAADGD